MTIRPFILSLIVLFSSPGFSDSILVGNAGEGILADGKVYLRDLFDNQLHLDPHIGPYVHRELRARLEDSRSLNNLNVDKDLLAKKLTDLNASFTGLGLYIIAAIQYYEWRLVEHPLVPFPDDGSPLKTKNLRVPLANRFMNVVRIQSAYWKKMDGNNQIALIIHEALASFQRVNCKNKVCSVDGHLLRDSVAYAFSPRLGRNVQFNKRFEIEFKLPNSEGLGSEPILLPTGIYKYGKKSGAILYQDPEQYVLKLCTLPFPEAFEFVIKRDPFYLMEQFFTADYGKHSYRLTHLYIAPVTPNLRVKGTSDIFNNSKVSGCFTYFNNILTPWMEYEPFTRFNGKSHHVDLDDLEEIRKNHVKD